MIPTVSDTDNPPDPPAPRLKRSLSLTLTTLYGLGTILGAGIYSLIGEVAGSAGMYAPVAFLVAALIAGFTGLSYAELAARFPRSAGEAVFVQEGLGWPPLSTLVGLLIVLTGAVSSALIQIIMASRVLYGISREGWLPAVIGRVHPRTRTPLVATAIITALVLVLAAPLSIRVLADTTSFIILVVYILVNLSLLRIKLRSPTATGVRPLPLWVPVTGLIASGGFVAMKLRELAAGIV